MQGSTYAERATRLRGLTLESWSIGALVATGALNLIVLFAQLPGLLNSLYRNPDTAVAQVLAALSANQGAGREVVLGNHPYYEAWWLEKATAGLPGHWQIWQAIPFVIAFVGIALMAWTAWRLLGVFGAAVTATLMLALGDGMRWILFTSDAHGYTMAHAALLIAAAVVLAERARRSAPSWLLLLGVAVPLVALSAAAGTDQLFEFVVLPSFALAGCLVWWQHRGPAQRRIAIFCVAVCGASILGAELLDALMSSQHVTSSYYGIAFLAGNKLLANLEVTITSLAYLGGGSFFGAPLRGHEFLVFVVGVLAIAAFALVLRFVWRRARALLERRETTAPPALDLYIAFWALVVVVSLAVYLLTNLPIGEGNARYLVGAYAGVAALLPILVGGNTARRTALAGTVAVFGVLVAANHLIEGPAPVLERVSPTASEARGIRQFLKNAGGADHGYAPYYVAPVVTWETHGGLKAYPVYECGTGFACPYFLGTINTWYKPKAGVRTFFIADTNEGIQGTLTGPVASFGQPLASAHFGTYVVYIYDHDLADDLR